MEEKSMNEMKNKLNFISVEDRAPVILYISNREMDFRAADLYERVKMITGVEFSFASWQ